MPATKLPILFLSVFLLSMICHAQTINVKFNIKPNATLIPKRSQFYIAGSINNWNPADSNYRFLEMPDGHYELSLAMPAGINEYKVTRGSWETAETKQNGQPLSNRSLMLKKDTVIDLEILQWQDNFKSTAKIHTAGKNVHVLDSTFEMPQLNRKRRIWVYLPPDYQTSGKSYPVIYMHDGQNLFDSYTSGYGEWGVDESMDSLFEKKSPMAIIVGIDHGSEHRLTEYNPFSNERFGKGRGDDYVDFLAHTLKPFIDQKFRTKSSSKNTIVAGSSMGGLISIYAAAKYPKVFGKAGVFSPAFWIAPEINSYLSGRKFRKQKLYFIAGDLESKDMVPDMKKIYDQLLSQGIKKNHILFKASSDGKHSEWFWKREYPQFYNWIMN